MSSSNFLCGIGNCGTGKKLRYVGCALGNKADAVLGSKTASKKSRVSSVGMCYRDCLTILSEFCGIIKI